MSLVEMDDAGRIRDQYRSSLGREASDDEVQGWLSGQFGGGDLNTRLKQIAGSHEAQQRTPQQPDYGITLGQQPDVNHGFNTHDAGGGPAQDYSSALGNAYQQYLGRSASPDEINNWWSGQFGYGSGWDNFNQAREAIRTSGEARGRNNGQAPNPYYQDTYWWNSQGVKDSDIFDLTTGQIRPGWQRTARGYERTAGTTGTGTTQGPPGGNFQSWFQQLTGGKPPTPESLEALGPELAKYGITLGSKGNRGWTDTIILPDGRTFDVIEAAGIGTGKNWVWQQNGGPGYVGGVGGGQAPGNQYSDPYTQFLEQLIKSRIGSLQGGYDDQYRQQYQSALQQRANALGQGNQQLDQLMKYLNERFTDLKGPGYTGAENEVLRTAALDPVENDRNAARKRVVERLAARGISQESGIYEAAMQEVDKAFDAVRGQNQTTLAANELGRRENRAQRAEMIGAQIADIPEQRAREQLDVFGALERLSMLARQEDEARSREAISYGGVLSDLGPQRLNLAMQAAGMGGNPSGLSNTLMQIAGLNQNAAGMNQANSNSLWSGLGTLAAIIARSGQSGLSGVGI